MEKKKSGKQFCRVEGPFGRLIRIAGFSSPPQAKSLDYKRLTTPISQ